MYTTACPLFIFLRFFWWKSQEKVGKFTFVSTKLASKRAIKLGGGYSRHFFQRFAPKTISRIVSPAEALREITPVTIESFFVVKKPQNGTTTGQILPTIWQNQAFCQPYATTCTHITPVIKVSSDHVGPFIVQSLNHSIVGYSFIRSFEWLDSFDEYTGCSV